ncbi:MAG: archease [Candidatus Lokiarchaeota archaeon]|nr:archease [Candidatus Lokiarchaeota archaeon]MBD3201871.1 archease [Candidatus Lokiarchaeota archaeon]
MEKSGYEFLDHTADVKVKCWGETLESAFSQAAYSLIATITPDLSKIKRKSEKTIKLEAEDKEALLFDFLSEFLYIFDVERLVFSDIKVIYIEELEASLKMKAELKGETFNKDIHEIGTEVKAITYSYMEINEKKNRTEIKIVFDI